MDLSDPTTATLAVADAFRRAALPHAVYGGLALAAYGEPRETKDADLAVSGVPAAAALAALRAGGLDVALTFEAVRFGGNTVTRVALLGGEAAIGLNVLDLVEPRSPRYARAAVGRRIEGTIRGRPIAVLTPEDFILLKVLSTRDRDLDDAASVVRTLRPTLDLALVRAEAAALAREVPDHDVAGRLARVLAQGTTPP